MELKKLGMAAVPNIIAHLDDGRPTRCKGHWRSYWPDGHYLLRYGDCCQQIFEAITGKTIHTSGGYPMQDGNGKKCKERAELWWQNYQKKGEKQVLVEETASGTRDSSHFAKTLADKYPEAALAPLFEGIRASTDKHVRANLISVVAKLKSDKVPPLLIEELKGPHLDSRVRAAVLLAARGEPAGYDALGEEWKKLAAAKIDRWEHGRAIDELTGAMIRSGNPSILIELRKT